MVVQTSFGATGALGTPVIPEEEPWVLPKKEMGAVTNRHRAHFLTSAWNVYSAPGLQRKPNETVGL